MGTSLYEQYLGEQGEKPPRQRSLYEEYQREKGRGMTDLLTEQGLLGKKPLALDVRLPSESTSALPRNRKDPSGDAEAVFPSLARHAAGVVMSAAQAVPGMEAAQAGARSLVRGQPYRQSLKDIRGVTDEINPLVKFAAQAPLLVGGAGALTKLPKVGAAMRSPAIAGGTIGVADQALDADDKSLETRLTRTLIGGAVGAGVGKSLDAIVTGTRAVKAKPYGANKTAREDAMSALDDRTYGAAAAEGAATGGTSPAVQAVLRDPKVSPLVKALRETEEFAYADDVTILRELYTQLGEKQRALGRVVEAADDFRPSPRLQKKEIERTKRKLLVAADEAMPSYRGAVRQHAAKEGELEALEHGKEAARQVIGKLEPTSRKAIRKGPHALRRKVPNMTLEERLAAEEGALSQLKRSVGAEANLISGAGLLTSALRPMRVGPLLRDIGTPRQVLLDDLIRSSLGGTAAWVP